MPMSLSQFIIWIVRLLFSFSCYLGHIHFQSYFTIFKHCCCCFEDFLVKIPCNLILFVFFALLNFDHTAYKGCYMPLEPVFYVDFDFSGFKSLMVSQKKKSLLNYVPPAPLRLTCLCVLRIFGP